MFIKKDILKSNQWANLTVMYSSEKSSERSKIVHRLYLLQAINAKNFLKPNEEGPN